MTNGHCWSAPRRGGLSAPAPCWRRCWVGDGRSSGPHHAPSQFEPSQLHPVTTVEVVINAEAACVLALLDQFPAALALVVFRALDDPVELS
jgi:hypothetical protein